MREILFRGKRADNGEWVEGNLFIPDYPDKPTEICIGTNVVRITYEVIPETVGQYTGLTDKNGKKVFEGDIVRDEQSGYECAIKWFSEYACFVGLANNSGHMEYEFDEFVISLNNLIVVGSIHDNSEYMEVSK